MVEKDAAVDEPSQAQRDELMAATAKVGTDLHLRADTRGYATRALGWLSWCAKVDGDEMVDRVNAAKAVLSTDCEATMDKYRVWVLDLEAAGAAVQLVGWTPHPRACDTYYPPSGVPTTGHWLSFGRRARRR